MHIRILFMHTSISNFTGNVKSRGQSILSADMQLQCCQIEARRPLVGQNNVIAPRSRGLWTAPTATTNHPHNLHSVKATIKTFFGRIILLPSLSISPPPLFHGF
ncbi:unnamed protein product [Brassica rapa]|uniref:Uncharacterized protein n=1 Tax=Brassica campestris TaxID=3711 RepID=A0A3P5ZQM2_BRACM|nr:unnamed protein product [Brassica rapa]VDC74318.1 unnamed protein product [Brassica rapa]